MFNPLDFLGHLVQESKKDQALRRKAQGRMMKSFGYTIGGQSHPIQGMQFASNLRHKRKINRLRMRSALKRKHRQS